MIMAMRGKVVIYDRVQQVWSEGRPVARGRKQDSSKAVGNLTDISEDQDIKISHFRKVFIAQEAGGRTSN